MIEFTDNANFEYCVNPKSLNMVEFNGVTVRLHFKNETIKVEFDSVEECMMQYNRIKEAMNEAI